MTIYEYILILHIGAARMVNCTWHFVIGRKGEPPPSASRAIASNPALWSMHQYMILEFSLYVKTSFGKRKLMPDVFSDFDPQRLHTWVPLGVWK